MLASFVRARGHSVEVAADGVAALEMVRRENYDLVFSDVRMVGLDGLALLRAIRQRWPDVVVVLMTAYATVAQAVEAMRAGAYDYLVKPFSIEEVGLTLDRVLEVLALRRENRALKSALDRPVLLESRNPGMTTQHIVDVAESFEKLLIVGAGVSGCEFASIFAALGVDVTLLDSAPRLLNNEDEDLSALITEVYRRSGIDVRFSARTQSMERVGGRVKTTLADGSVILTDRALLSIGREGMTSDLGLEAAGVTVSRGGVVAVNDCLQTNVPHIYAVGDVGVRNTPLDMIRDPESVGLWPDGEPPTPSALVASPGQRLDEVCWTAPFLLLIAIYFLTWVPVFVPFVHAAAYAEDLGLSKLAAGSVISVIGIGGVLGRLSTGVVSDRIGRLPSLLAMMQGAVHLVIFAAFLFLAFVP